MTRPTITGPDRIRIAAEAVLCERSVRRAYDGTVSDYTLARVRQAAERLGLPAPPEPSRPSEQD